VATVNFYVAPGAVPAPLSNNPALPLGPAAPGVAGAVSRDDHVHPHGDQAGGTLHALVTTLVDGFMSPADFDKLFGLPDGATLATILSNLVPNTRDVAAGTGLTGGGALNANITLNVVANADGSIVVNANDVQVGILATDAQHGARGGDTQHALSTALLAGFMSAADFSKLAGVVANAGPSFLHWGDNSVSGTTTTRYMYPGYDALASPTVIQYRVPAACRLRNLYVRHNIPAGNGLSIVYTVRVNNIATALAVSLASTSADGSDLVNTISLVAGDLIDIEVTKAASVGTSPSDIVASLEVIAP
jgi:hypothetical protein